MTLACPLFAFAIICVALSGAALAQPSFPQKPVTLVAPYPPGGPVDIVARMLAKGLTPTWSKPIVIENRTGAGGNIGSEAVAKAAPDGHTLLINTGALLVTAIVSEKLPFDPIRDFAPITKIGFAPALLVVNPKSPFNTVADLVAYGKANPGKLSFGSPGNATTLQLCSELFKTLAGFDALHIPFRGSAPSVAALIGDQIHFHFDAMLSALAHVNAGTLKALAVSTAARSLQAPNIPTMVEAGVPGYDASIWFGVFAPAATPAPLVEKIARDIQLTLQQPDIKKQLESTGFIIVGNAPQQLAKEMAAESKMWVDVIRKTGVKVE
ncbi:MAG: Bug family tripartite tricarboxylate transporter substrate binding protein [Burkholderiales bacterium]